ncbi:MAG: hypothetical protein AAF728_20480 [Cyanobacteria bacterium P01_D01_bin.128]
MKKSQTRQLKRIWKGLIRYWLGWGMLAILLIPTVAIAHNRQLWSPQTAQLDLPTTAATSPLENSIAQATQTDEQSDEAIQAAVVQTTLDDLLADASNATVEPEVYQTVILGDYALASWLWGEGGGQSVLSKESGEWQVLSSGGGAVDAATLETLGIPADAARTLIEHSQAEQE